jgi:hypothetical protein
MRVREPLRRLPVIDQAADASFDLLEIPGVQDDRARTLRPKALLNAHMRKGDCSPNARTTAQSFDLSGEEVREMSLARLSLIERVADRDEASGGLAPEVPAFPDDDVAALCLDDEDAVHRVEQRKVGLAVALTTTSYGLPFDVVKDHPRVVELAQPREHTPLGVILGFTVLWEDPRHT